MTMKVFILYLSFLLPFLGLTIFRFTDIKERVDANKLQEHRIFVEPTEDFKCPQAAEPTYVSDYNIHANFLDQADQIFTYAGPLINVAVYGIKSAFSDTTTFLLDDIFIFAFSLTPIFSWYFITKPLYSLVKVDEKVVLITLAISSAFIFLLIVTFLFIYNWPCHKFLNNPAWIERSRNLFTKKRLGWIKCIIIHIYFLHSIVILYFDTIFTIIYVMEYQPTLYGNYVNFQLLNFLTDFLYILLNLILIIDFYKPRFIVGKIIVGKTGNTDRYREYMEFIHMKIFFYVVFLSSIQLLFEFSLTCTPPYIDKIFNFIITTILTRSASSFFANHKDIILCGSKVTLLYGKDERENDPRKQYGIEVISSNPNESMDLHGIRMLVTEKTKRRAGSEITGTLVYASIIKENDEGTFKVNEKTIDIKDGKIHSSYKGPAITSATKVIIVDNARIEVKGFKIFNVDGQFISIIGFSINEKLIKLQLFTNNANKIEISEGILDEEIKRIFNDSINSKNILEYLEKQTNFEEQQTNFEELNKYINDKNGKSIDIQTNKHDETKKLDIKSIETEHLNIKTIDIVDGTIKLDITDGFGFINYIIYEHRTKPKLDQNDQNV